MNYLDELKGYSLVIHKNDKVFTFTDRGIKPLLAAIEKGLLEDAIVIDRVTGRASALLIVYAKAREIYTKTLSAPAEAILKEHNLKYYAENTVSNIINRTNSGICPMEEMTLDISDPTVAYKLLKDKIK